MQIIQNATLMKILLKIIILTDLFLGTKLYAQDLDRKNLISQLNTDKESLFVINGILFSPSDSLKLDTELNKIDKNKISEITILKNERKICHQRQDVIIIQYATKLSKKNSQDKTERN